MNLVIDIGNSQTKVALFDAGEIVQTFFMKLFDGDQLRNIKQTYPTMTNAILSTVGTIEPNMPEILKEEFEFFLGFNHLTPVPIENLYESKTTLGLDRLAAAVGAVALFPGRELLVIDAGSAITFDLIDRNNRFLGGNISPGLAMRFKALHTFTSKLPEIVAGDHYPEFGTTTEEAIRSGVQLGMIYEIDGVIDQIRHKWPECKVILTGGDSHFFDKKLKNTIFVKFELTLIGLNRILEFNVINK
ncbi:MAG: type III pantothenate kinase [Mariniphaga sp.]